VLEIDKPINENDEAIFINRFINLKDCAESLPDKLKTVKERLVKKCLNIFDLNPNLLGVYIQNSCIEVAKKEGRKIFKMTGKNFPEYNNDQKGLVGTFLALVGQSQKVWAHEQKFCNDEQTEQLLNDNLIIMEWAYHNLQIKLGMTEEDGKVFEGNMLKNFGK
jgi:hypothetical protein